MSTSNQNLTPYTSIHSGIDIDRAVSYYLSLNSYGRTIINVPVSTDNWEEILPVDLNDKNTSRYSLTITLNGSDNLGGAPIVYFVSSGSDDFGQKYEMDHTFGPLGVENGVVAFNPSKIQYIECYSNTSKAGAIVLVANLSDPNFKAELDSETPESGAGDQETGDSEASGSGTTGSGTDGSETGGQGSGEQGSGEQGSTDQGSDGTETDGTETDPETGDQGGYSGQ